MELFGGLFLFGSNSSSGWGSFGFGGTSASNLNPGFGGWFVVERIFRVGLTVRGGLKMEL